MDVEAGRLILWNDKKNLSPTFSGVLIHYLYNRLAIRYTLWFLVGFPELS